MSFSTDIERTYGGGEKPIASKEVPAPLSWVPDVDEVPKRSTTPSVTDGETDDNDDSAVPMTPKDDERRNSVELTQIQAVHRGLSFREISLRYLQRPAIIFSNLDFFRATDFCFTLLVSYVLLPALLQPVLSTRPRLCIALYFMHALAWRLFHSFGLGLLLKAQSEERWLIRHFLKHYHYPANHRRQSFSASVAQPSNAKFAVDASQEESSDDIMAATKDAFDNWKVLYNTSLVMTYVSFICVAWRIYSIPHDWTVHGQLLRHVLGCLLIALHLWCARSSYEVLGAFGWLYSDFFLVEKTPANLAYTGIYRFLNNPEHSMGGAAFFGLALISGSKTVAFLAIVSHVSHWWFLTFVEKPHMKKLYGKRLRKDGGLTKTLKNITGKHAKSLESRAGKHAPEIKRVVSEVKDTMVRVEERVTEAVEEFLHSGKLPLVLCVTSVQD